MHPSTSFFFFFFFCALSHISFKLSLETNTFKKISKPKIKPHPLRIPTKTKNQILSMLKSQTHILYSPIMAPIDPHSFIDLSHRLSTPLTLRGNGDWGLLCLFDALRLHCIYDYDYEDYLFGYQEKIRGLIFVFEFFFFFFLNNFIYVFVSQ